MEDGCLRLEYAAVSVESLGLDFFIILSFDLVVAAVAEVERGLVAELDENAVDEVWVVVEIPEDEEMLEGTLRLRLVLSLC